MDTDKNRKCSGSQTRKRRIRHVGHYDETENALFDEAFAAYRGSAAATQHGDSEAAFVRYMTIGDGARALPRRSPTRRRQLQCDLPEGAQDKLAALITGLAPIGNNANQLAFRKNDNQPPPPPEIVEAAHEIMAVVRDIRKILGIQQRDY